MALGYAIVFHEDPLAASPAISYWNGRTVTTDASATALNESDTFLDTEIVETDLMTLLGNVQIAHPDKHARLRRVEVTVALVP
jgi:hypothetical protein